MSVLMSEDKKEIIITCKCGCGEAFYIAIDDSEKDSDYYGYMCFMRNNFHTEQFLNPWQAFKEKMGKIWTIIKGKDYIYSDTLMSRAEFETFKNYVNQF